MNIDKSTNLKKNNNPDNTKPFKIETTQLTSQINNENSKNKNQNQYKKFIDAKNKPTNTQVKTEIKLDENNNFIKKNKDAASQYRKNQIISKLKEKQTAFQNKTKEKQAKIEDYKEHEPRSAIVGRLLGQETTDVNESREEVNEHGLNQSPTKWKIVTENSHLVISNNCDQNISDNRPPKVTPSSIGKFQFEYLTQNKTNHLKDKTTFAKNQLGNRQSQINVTKKQNTTQSTTREQINVNPKRSKLPNKFEDQSYQQLTRDQCVADQNFRNDQEDEALGQEVSSFDSDDSDKSAYRGPEKLEETCIPRWWKDPKVLSELIQRTKRINPVDVFGRVQPIGSQNPVDHKNMIKTLDHNKQGRDSYVNYKQRDLLKSGYHWDTIKIGAKEFVNQDTFHNQMKTEDYYK